MNEFGNLLSKLRKQKNMTQAQLASKLNLSDKAISRWETGDSYPETQHLIKLSEIFDITIDDLLKGKNNYKQIESDFEKCLNINTDKNSYDNMNDANNLNVDSNISNHRNYNQNEDNYINNSDDKNNSIKEKNTKIIGLISSILFSISALTYLLIGIFANLWHPTWIIFVVSAFIIGIVSTILGVPVFKNRKHHHHRHFDDNKNF